MRSFLLLVISVCVGFSTASPVQAQSKSSDESSFHLPNRLMEAQQASRFSSNGMAPKQQVHTQPTYRPSLRQRLSQPQVGTSQNQHIQNIRTQPVIRPEAFGPNKSSVGKASPNLEPENYSPSAFDSLDTRSADVKVPEPIISMPAVEVVPTTKEVAQPKLVGDQLFSTGQVVNNSQREFLPDSTTPTTIPNSVATELPVEEWDRSSLAKHANVQTQESLENIKRRQIQAQTISSESYYPRPEPNETVPESYVETVSESNQELEVTEVTPPQNVIVPPQAFMPAAPVPAVVQSGPAPVAVQQPVNFDTSNSCDRWEGFCGCDNATRNCPCGQFGERGFGRRASRSRDLGGLFGFGLLKFLDKPKCGCGNRKCDGACGVPIPQPASCDCGTCGECQAGSVDCPCGNASCGGCQKKGSFSVITINLNRRNQN